MKKFGIYFAVLFTFGLFDSMLLNAKVMTPEDEKLAKELFDVPEKDILYRAITQSNELKDYIDYGITLDEYPLSLGGEYEVIAAIRCEGKVRRSNVWHKPDFIIWGRNNNYEYLQIITMLTPNGGATHPFMKFIKEDRDGTLYFHNYFSFKTLVDAASPPLSIAHLYNMQVEENAIKISSVDLSVNVKDKVTLMNSVDIRFKSKYCNMIDKSKAQKYMNFWNNNWDYSSDYIDSIKKF